MSRLSEYPLFTTIMLTTLIFSSLIFSPQPINRPIIGMNQNWSYMPSVTNRDMVRNVRELRLEMVRYPGGTLTHFFNWQEGIITTRPQKVKQPLSAFKKFCDALSSKPIFVLDICNKTLEDQIKMLQEAKRLGFAIDHVELGNELYAQDKGYENVFPTGAEYGQKVNVWANEIKSKFPGAKVAALLLARSVRPQNARLYNWNALTLAATRQSVDAYTYHIYIGEAGGTFASTSTNFSNVVRRDNLGNKEIWVTEFGSQQAQSPTYLQDLDKLANFIESFPGVTIALNHQILGGDMNKLSKDGMTFTPEGELFIRRANARR